MNPEREGQEDILTNLEQQMPATPPPFPTSLSDNVNERKRKLQKLLQDNELDEYYEGLVDIGIDSPKRLKTINESMFRLFVDKCKIPPAHVEEFTVLRTVRKTPTRRRPRARSDPHLTNIGSATAPLDPPNSGEQAATDQANAQPSSPSQEGSQGATTETPQSEPKPRRRRNSSSSAVSSIPLDPEQEFKRRETEFQRVLGIWQENEAMTSEFKLEDFQFQQKNDFFVIRCPCAKEITAAPRRDRPSLNWQSVKKHLRDCKKCQKVKT